MRLLNDCAYLKNRLTMYGDAPTKTTVLNLIEDIEEVLEYDTLHADCISQDQYDDQASDYDTEIENLKEKLTQAETQLEETKCALANSQSDHDALASFIIKNITPILTALNAPPSGFNLDCTPTALSHTERLSAVLAEARKPRS